MDAVIHAVDTQRAASEGQVLTVKGARINVALKEYDGLPLGERKDQCFIELTAESYDGPTRSSLTAQLAADDLQRLLDLAVTAGLVKLPASKRVLDLLDELRTELER